MTTPLTMTNGSTSNPLNIKLAFISTNTPANGFEQSWGKSTRGGARRCENRARKAKPEQVPKQVCALPAGGKRHFCLFFSNKKQIISRGRDSRGVLLLRRGGVRQESS